MAIIQKYNPISGKFDFVNTGDNAFYFVQYGNLQNLSVADSTTYYCGMSQTIATSTNGISFVPLKAGTIIGVQTELYSAGTVASNEDGVLILWYNDGANSLTLATDFKVDANRHFFREFTGLSTAVNSGNSYIEFQSGNYATNPNALQLRVNVLIRP